MRLTANFTLEEFERASHRPLTTVEKERARYFAEELLQPIRPLVGPIVITSFVRVPPNVGAGPHGDGRGLDIVPQDRSRKRMELMHALLYLLRNKYGENLLEVDHVHLSYPGTDPRYPAGGPGQTLIELPGPRRTNWKEGIVWTALAMPALVVAGGIALLTR